MATQRSVRAISLVLCLTLLAGIAPGLTTAQDGGDIYLPLITYGSSEPSAFDLIDKAEAEGTLDAETALIYRFYAIFGDSRLPAQFHGADVDTPDVDALFQANERWASLSAATQAILVPFITPPIYVGSWFDLQQNGLAAATPPATPPPPEPICDAIANGWLFVLGNFAPVKVWWHTSHPEDLAKATAVASAMDNDIWPSLIGLMGEEHEPWKDGAVRCNGGDDRLDIYLDDLDNIWGVAAYFEDFDLGTAPGCRRRPVHIHMQRTLTGNVLLSMVTHEFMHAIQLTYHASEACSEYYWLWEATATWAIDYVYPDFNTEHPYARLFLDRPELSLETEEVALGGDKTANRSRGAYVFFFYLSRILGQPTLIKTIFDNTVRYDSLKAIDLAVPGHLKEQWPKFVKYALNRKPVTDFKDKDQLAHKVKMATNVPLPVFLGGEPDMELDIPATGIPHLAARYHHFTFPDSTVRSVGFFNGLRGNLTKRPWEIPTLMSPGMTYYVEPVPDEERRGVHIWAIVKYEGKDWEAPEDWTEHDYKGFCRDVTAERITDLVLIFSNSEYADRSYELEPQGMEPTLYVSNMGCWQWEGKTTWKEVAGGVTKQLEVNVTWQRVIIHPDSWLPTVLMPLSAIATYKVFGTDPDGCTHFADQTFTITPVEQHTMYIYDRILSGPAYRGYGGLALDMTAIMVQGICPDPEKSGTYILFVGWWYSPPTGINDELYWKTVKDDGTTIDDTEVFDFNGIITTETRQFVAKRQ